MKNKAENSPQDFVSGNSEHELRMEYLATEDELENLKKVRNLILAYKYHGKTGFKAWCVKYILRHRVNSSPMAS